MSLYARALLLRNCGRFTHVSSDFGSQYHTHLFVTSEALYASLTRGVTWRHESRFVDLDDDASKSSREDYFFCDYDVSRKPIWFTTGVFVDEQLRPLAKERRVVDKNDFNVVDEDYPSTGGNRRADYVPTYGRIESVLPNHLLFTCALSPQHSELETFLPQQTFLVGKKRTMFQLVRESDVVELGLSALTAQIDEYVPLQVKLDEMRNFREYQVLAATARYLVVHGRITEGQREVAANFSDWNRRCILPDFWIEHVNLWWGEQ
jgi:galactose-1-phosphate uridylyltransferase